MTTQVWVFTAPDRAARHQFALARAAERLACPPEFLALCHKASGRPVLTQSGKHPQLYVSLARAGLVGAVALSDSPGIGVDLETTLRPDQVNDILVRNILTPTERRSNDLPSPETLTEIWTRKEAVLKAMGVGLSVDPRTIELPPPQVGTLQQVTATNGDPYNLQTWQLSGSLRLSVCTRDESVSLHDDRTFNPNRSDKPMIG